MRIAHVSDTHLTEQRGDSGESLDEQVGRLMWCGEDANEEGAELLVHAGDVFDRLSSPAERNAAADVIEAWASQMPVVIVYGNHDRPGDLDYLGRLRTDHPVSVFDRPDICRISHLAIACLPWPRKAWLATHMEAGQDVADLAVEEMRRILLGFSVGFDMNSNTRILLAHAELGSAVMDNGQPLIGVADMPLGAGDLLETGADYVALGHIHKHQVSADRIAYAGSPRQCTFGEDPQKGYCLVDVERGKAPVIEHRQAPGRELVTVEAAWPIESSPAGHVGMLVTDNDITVEEELLWRTGDIYRLVYSVSEANRAAAREQAERAKAAWLDAGAHSVKIDARTLTTTRLRSEAIREARTDEDRLRALWDARGETPDRSGSLLAKMVELQAEVTP